MLIRYFAAARAAAGTDTEVLDLGPGALSRREVEQRLVLRHPDPPPGQPPLAQVLARSSFLLDGVACPDPATVLTDTSVLDVLPPFSGG
ncbi:MoaD/ThiS family protein [Kocuria turfanensis]|uniref:MoaD/ThiS family protein n=1 Tax=Kocuria turfanensis TaxID=388357 RepID=UPI000789595E|nr:MoaD/ThiS family protein [Kocuria turfanensis]